MLNEANIENTSLEGETFASKDEKRRRVRNQPRDANGRWVSAGANVKWTHNSKHFTGVVKKLDNDDAVVSVNLPGGKTDTAKIKTSDIEVSTSKARLPKPETEHYSEGNSFKDTINSPEFQKDLLETGEASITRQDGYALQAKKEEGDGNPIMYQLFAPGGKSLGQYGPEAVGTFDEMVEVDQVEVTTPATAPVGVAASAVLRVARKGNKALVRQNDTYQIVTTDQNHKVIFESDSYKQALAADTWRRPLKEESESLVASLAARSDVITDDTPKPYRVPEAVKTEILAALENLDDIPADDLKYAKSLAYNDSVSEEEVEWVNSFFATQDAPQKLRGGYKGQKWASKILSKDAIEEESAYSVIEEDALAYFAIGNDAEAVTDLLGIDFDNEQVRVWENSAWKVVENLSIDDIDEPYLAEIDHESARSLASWKDNPQEETSFNLLALDPEERNLFSLAESEMDMEELDRLTGIVADAGYTPVERSVNAQNQPRGSGGKFGSKQDAPAAAPVAEEAPVQKPIKAKLEVELPLITDTAARLNEWLLTAPITASAESNAESKSLYFAIVDAADKSAVLDVVAITKNDLGEPEAWLRAGGTWTPSADMLISLQGAAPPPVVELDVPDPIKAVLAQVDEYDNKSAEPATEEAPAAPAPAPTTTEEAPAPVAAGGYSDEQRKKDAKKGYAMPSGAYPIHNESDLKDAIKAFGRAKEDEKADVKRHIKKRAKALNRMDLVPDKWRETSMIEYGEALLAQSPLFGDYGEVITAAGGLNGVTGEARLKAYWRSGKGAAKIRWGSPGDLTRCARQVAKYIPGKEFGFCQNLHMDKYGVSNRTKDGK